MKTLNGADEPGPTNTTAWWGWCASCGLHFNNHLVGCANVRVSVWHNNATMPIRSWSFPKTTGTLTS